MFCDCCCSCFKVDSNQKISPSDANFVKHKQVELKDNKKIHVIHINCDSDVIESNVDEKTEKPLTDISKIKDPPEASTDVVVVTSQPSTSLNNDDIKSKIQIHFIASAFASNIELKTNEKEKYSIYYKNSLNQPSRYKVGEPSTKLCPKPLLFLIHGVGGCSKIWTKQLVYFGSKGYEIVAIDLIGHGESSTNLKESDFQFQNLANDILACFDKFAKPNSVIIGHSYGCSFATYLAHFRKDKIKKIILISGSSPYPLDYQSILLKAPHMRSLFFSSAFNSFCNKPANSRDTFSLRSDFLQYMMKGQSWLAGDEKFHKSLPQTMLLIEGENDRFVPLQESMDMVKFVEKSYLILVKNGSHMVIMESHDIVNEVIFEFLNDQYPI